MRRPHARSFVQTAISRFSRASGAGNRGSDALVHAGRSTRHGDFGKRRTARLVRLAQPLIPANWASLNKVPSLIL